MSDLSTRVDEGEQMETKSEFELAMDEGRRIAESIIDNNKASAEHQRLQSAVVKIALSCRASVKAHIAPCSRVYSENDLWRAVDALIAYEKQIGIGDK